MNKLADCFNEDYKKTPSKTTQGTWHGFYIHSGKANCMFKKIQTPVTTFFNTFAATKNRSKSFQIAISVLVLTIFIFTISRVVYLTVHGTLAHI